MSTIELAGRTEWHFCRQAYCEVAAYVPNNQDAVLLAHKHLLYSDFYRPVELGLELGGVADAYFGDDALHGFN
ncbi:hypothetical protein [Pseudarthrobacter sp. MDT1-22]